MLNTTNIITASCTQIAKYMDPESQIRLKLNTTNEMREHWALGHWSAVAKLIHTTLCLVPANGVQKAN